MRQAVFFDRDGVLNELVERNSQLVSPRTFIDFKVYPEAIRIVNEVQELGFATVLVTNQPDIARGKMPFRELDQMLSYLRQVMPFNMIRYCPHDNFENCSCRKPRPGMLTEAARKLDLDLSRSVIVGDSWKDMEAGRKAGVKTILLDRPYNAGTHADWHVDSLAGILPLLDLL